MKDSKDMSEQEIRIRLHILALLVKAVEDCDFVEKCIDLENKNNTMIIAMELLAIPSTCVEMKFVSQLGGSTKAIQDWVDFTDSQGMRNDTASTYNLAVEHLEKVK